MSIEITQYLQGHNRYWLPPHEDFRGLALLERLDYLREKYPPAVGDLAELLGTAYVKGGGAGDVPISQMERHLGLSWASGELQQVFQTLVNEEMVVPISPPIDLDDFVELVQHMRHYYTDEELGLTCL